jgi:hypothetical protein
MRFYQQSHQFYCGVDLHARSMHVCLVDHEGQIKAHKNIDARPDRFLPPIRPYRGGWSWQLRGALFTYTEHVPRTTRHEP